MITLIILGVIQLRKDNMAIKPRNGGDTGSTPVPGTRDTYSKKIFYKTLQKFE